MVIPPFRPSHLPAVARDSHSAGEREAERRHCAGEQEDQPDRWPASSGGPAPARAAPAVAAGVVEAVGKLAAWTMRR